MALVLAHLSDLHVSRYGEHVTSLRTSLRSKQGKADEDWEEVQVIDGWVIQKRAKWRWRLRDTEDALEMRLLDDEGYVQARRKGRRADLAAICKDLEQVTAERHLTHHTRLARNLPSPSKVEELLEEDPTNTNLLFLRAAHAVTSSKPDWIAISGDVTDDGIGYDLVLTAFARYVDKGRLLAIPGNHDVYDSPPFVVPPHERKGVKTKRALWAPFARELGLPEAGPWLRELGEGAAMAAIDSCNPAWTPLSASGEVTPETLTELGKLVEQSDFPIRIGMLHHHVVNPPFLHVGRAPWQLGMRLRNAKDVYDFFVANRFAVVLNGHRHLGYRYHPPWAPLFLSAPSATLGDRTGIRPFYWSLTLDGGEVANVRERRLGPSDQ